MTVDKHLDTTQLAIYLEDKLLQYRRSNDAIPNTLEGQEYQEYTDRLEQLGFRKAADYYRKEWGPIYQRRARKFAKI